jgi:uncharacterized RDD family membrane protein YckC
MAKPSVESGPRGRRFIIGFAAAALVLFGAGIVAAAVGALIEGKGVSGAMTAAWPMVGPAVLSAGLLMWMSRPSSTPTVGAG